MEIITRCPHCEGNLVITIVKREAVAVVPAVYEDVKCPECGGPMVSRNGKYGVFWGCKKYPDCAGTRDSEGRSKAERNAEPKQQERGFSFTRASRVDTVE
jgi:ssDNA-binding Zn-finger/Zn-ribbon topoisomerase 1